MKQLRLIRLGYKASGTDRSEATSCRLTTASTRRDRGKNGTISVYFASAHDPTLVLQANAIGSRRCALISQHH